MIRRITKNNDLKDLIKSCPTGVIDDIYSIRYYIEGNPDVEIEPTFSKVNNHLEVVIPSSMLDNLGNGILMRRSLYKASDPEYPDGYYNLEFIDNMNIWLGGDVFDPFDLCYLTAEDLKTVNNQSLVGSGNIEISVDLTGYATESWVESQGYLTSAVMSGYATQSWVQNQGYITSIPSGYATESWVQSQGYITSAGISGLATMSWVEAQGYITSETLPEDIATQSWVSSNFLSTTALTGYATESWVQSQGYASAADLGSYATEDWVEEQGYITSTGLSGLATQSWVLSQNYLNSQSLTGYATESWVSSNYVSTTTLSNYTTFSDIDTYISSFWNRAAEEFYSDYVPRREIGSYLSGYATESWVESQGYLTSHQDLSSYATKSWVESQGYITSTALSGYATESWVESQGYLTSHQDLSSYATKSWVSESLSSYTTQSWVSTNYLPQSAVWTGTQSEWIQLTSEEKATYIIALVTD